MLAAVRGPRHRNAVQTVLYDRASLPPARGSGSGIELQDGCLRGRRRARSRGLRRGLGLAGEAVLLDERVEQLDGSGIGKWDFVGLERLHTLELGHVRSRP